MTHTSVNYKYPINIIQYMLLVNLIYYFSTQTFQCLFLYLDTNSMYTRPWPGGRAFGGHCSSWLCSKLWAGATSSTMPYCQHGSTMLQNQQDGSTECSSKKQKHCVLKSTVCSKDLKPWCLAERGQAVLSQMLTKPNTTSNCSSQNLAWQYPLCIFLPQQGCSLEKGFFFGETTYHWPFSWAFALQEWLSCLGTLLTKNCILLQSLLAPWTQEGHWSPL